MIKTVIKKIYRSSFSKKIGLYNHPIIIKTKETKRNLKIKIRRRKELKYVHSVSAGKENLSRKFLKENTYEFMYELSLINPEIWGRLLNQIADSNFSRLAKHTKINVMFLCNFSATWSCDELFQLFLKSDRFHPYIVVHHFYNGTQQTIEENFNDCFRFFSRKGYEVYKDSDTKINEWFSLEKLGNPDIIFHLSPYNSGFPKTLDIFSFPLETININIPYGIYVAELSDFQYNLPSFSAYWRIFDLPFYAKLAPKYTKLGNVNRVGSGYCKLDALYKTEYIVPEEIWKITNHKQVKIIFAPHHSIGELGQKFSTFDKNYQAIYEIAQSLQETTTWIFKPHPLLKKAAVESGVFSDEKEYDAYVEKWNKLPNARVITGGDYFDIFKTSDGMILDSDSFLAEYLYVNKPIMLLTRESQKFSELGVPLSKVLYRVNGEDFQGILHFITEVLVEKNDTMADLRKNFFEAYLDYKKKNGMLASEYIYQYICKKIKDF